MIDGELVSLCPNKPFQTLKHHNLLSVLRLGSGQPVQRSQLLCLWGGVLGACSILHIHHNLVFAIGRCSGQLWQVPLPFPYGSMFGIACLNDQINTVLLSAIRRDSGQPVQILKKKQYKLRPVRLRLGEFRICLFQYPSPLYNDGSAGSSLLVYTKF